MAEIKGADLMAKSLKEQGVQYMFGVVGFPVGPIAEAAQKVCLPYIGMRNEQAASYAAGAVGFLTGRPGACIVVTGPGVIDTSTNYVEHPELVAERLCRFADIVGRERVMATSDCGFGTFAGYGKIDPDIAFKKLQAMADGAAIASQRLWRRA